MRLAWLPIAFLASLCLLATAASSDTITWETAADWDASVDSQDVVHDTIGDRTDAGQTRLGYPATDQNGSDLLHYWPLDTDNGTNTYPDEAGAADVTCTAVDATIGVFDTDAYHAGKSSCDAANGEVLDDDFTVSAWALSDGTNDQFEIIYINGESGGSPVSPALINVDNSGNLRFFVEAEDNTGCAAQGPAVPSGLFHVVGRFDTGNCDIFVDGSHEGSDTSVGLSSGSSQEHSIGGDEGSNLWSGRIDEVRVYNRTLSNDEISLLADSTGTLTTANKSFSFAGKPDLVNVTSTEPAGDADASTLTVVGSPDTASEETQTVTLDGSSSYNLGWSEDHSTFRLEPNFTVDDITTTPTLSSAALQANDTGTGNDPPTASFTTDCSGLTCDFNASDSTDPDGSITSFDWEFGDGNTGTGETTTHTYANPGTYQVNLTVTDDSGDTDTDSQNVTVDNGDAVQVDAEVWDVDEDLLEDEPARLCVNTSIDMTSAPDEVWVSYEDTYPSGNTSDRDPTTRLLMDSDRCVALDNRPNANTFLWANITNATGTRLDGFWHVGDAPLSQVSDAGGSEETVESFTSMTASEMAWFAGMAIAGIILWSRSLDPGVRVFGAFLPLLAGTLMIGFGASQGFGSLWDGTLAFATGLVLIGAYLFARVFLEMIADGSQEAGVL